MLCSKLQESDLEIYTDDQLIGLSTFQPITDTLTSMDVRTTTDMISKTWECAQDLMRDTAYVYNNADHKEFHMRVDVNTVLLTSDHVNLNDGTWTVSDPQLEETVRVMEPADEGSIQNLETVDVVGSELQFCVICMEDIEVGSKATRMPCDCGRLFHVDCITTWLRTKNSCPLCRYELP
ncbi:hypothetical protein ACFE04_014755 [Oxalis oulophora]